MKTASPPLSTSSQKPAEVASYTRRHLQFGWWSVLIFLTLGIVLEGFHGFKVAWYLKVSNETRRLMWTLAHAHGTLLGLMHVAFAATVPLAPAWNPRPRSFASRCLMAASILVPGGFFVGGLVIYAGDPGLGIVLVPIGAVLLFTAVFLTAKGVRGPKIRNPEQELLKPPGKGKPIA